MNPTRKFVSRAIWALLFLLNIGAAIALNVSAPETSANPVDLSETPGWVTIIPNYGGTYYYNDQVGLVEKAPDQVEKETPWNSLREIPGWLFFQLIIGTIGFILVTVKRPNPLGFQHRINIAFGFLMIAWLNLAISAIRLNQVAADIVPDGYIRVAYPQGQLSAGSPPTESVYLLAMGFGISIFLGYLWIRWDRANRPEESFL